MKTSLFFILLSSLLIRSSWARLPDEQNNIDVYQKCNPSVVNITTVTLTQDFFFDIVPQKGVGSGAIIRADGYIVTNDHVIGNAQNVEVTLFDKGQFSAEVVGADPDSDLAVLKIKPGDRKLVAMEYGTNESLIVGQKTLAIGNPFGLGGSLSIGVVSSLGREIRAPSDRIIKEVIQTDAPINPGNSGGPLIDSSGRLIGINSQIFSRAGGSDGIGFAIPVKMVKSIVQQLIAHGKVLRPELGFFGVGLSEGLLQNLQLPSDHGIMVTRLTPKSALARAGLKPANQQLVYGFLRIRIAGDLIVQLDDVKVTSMRDALDYLTDKKVGETIVVHYLRGKVKKSVSVKLTLSSRDRGDSL